jgi:hypothetical protein
MHRRRLDGQSIGRARRIDIAVRQHLHGEMARPARAIPAVQAAAGLGVVEHHARMVAVDHVVEAVDVVGRFVVEVHHHHLGAGAVDHFAAQRAQRTLVHDACTAFAQGFAQMRPEFRVVEQQSDCRGFSHGRTPWPDPAAHAAPALR